MTRTTRSVAALLSTNAAATKGEVGLCDFGPEIDRFLDFALDRYTFDKARIKPRDLSPRPD